MKTSASNLRALQPRPHHYNLRDFRANFLQVLTWMQTNNWNETSTMTKQQVHTSENFILIWSKAPFHYNWCLHSRNLARQLVGTKINYNSLEHRKCLTPGHRENRIAKYNIVWITWTKCNGIDSSLSLSEADVLHYFSNFVSAIIMDCQTNSTTDIKQFTRH